MKKVLSVYLLLAFFAVVVNAQGRPDVLETSKYFKSGYIGLVERMLLPEPSEDYLTYNGAGFLNLPSWSGEQSVCLEKTDNDNYKLVLRRAPQNIWYAARHLMVHYEDEVIDYGDHKTTYAKEVSNGIGWDEVQLDMKIDEKELEITYGQAAVLSGLFKMAVVSSSPAAQSMGFDGETTLYFYNGYAAECWSPDAGKLKRLVDISNAIKEAIINNDSTAIQDIIPEVQALTREFRELIPEWGLENMKYNPL